MKKPAKTVVTGWATIKVPAQPGNAPGRGKSAHAKPAARKPPPKGGPPKIVPGWFHPAVQAAQKKKAAAKKAKKHPKRQLALGEGVACCAAEALAASLRLLGVPVGDGDVLDLYWRTAADPDAGASILATLEAAERYGLAGIRPVSWQPVKVPDFMPADIPALLGVDLPGPHAVLATPDGWHSWGGLYDPAVFPDAVIEEAWEVTW